MNGWKQDVFFLMNLKSASEVSRNLLCWHVNIAAEMRSRTLFSVSIDEWQRYGRELSIDCHAQPFHDWRDRGSQFRCRGWEADEWSPMNIKTLKSFMRLTWTCTCIHERSDHSISKKIQWMNNVEPTVYYLEISKRKCDSFPGVFLWRSDNIQS